jgi:hypothetical protein
MLPSHELDILINNGKFDEAIKFCKQKIEIGVGKPFYIYKLAKLNDNYYKNKLIAGDNKKTPSDHFENKNIFADFEYEKLKEEILEDDLNNQKKVLLSRTPFKSNIYLPTEKMLLKDQITGLQNVENIISTVNVEVSKNKFNRLKDFYTDSGKKRIFIIGNGPSLKETDLSLLNEEFTIGFNGIFLHDTFTPKVYIVEDHLVAEDRINEINNFNCFVKIFPSYLAYCIKPQSNIIFLNHRPRKSYPVDMDFSGNAGEITFTGGTVTYTAIQVAVSLGAEEVILVGVDASYNIFNVHRDEKYNIGILTSKEDDINHFDSRYFGEGYRWHDPNVDIMLQSYRKAKSYCDSSGIRILNATVGGALEVFPRVNFWTLFDTKKSMPNVAILDFTSVDRNSATGVIKRNLLTGWFDSSKLHIYADEKSRLIAFQKKANDRYLKNADDNSVCPALRSLIEFDPDVLYLRPTHDRIAMLLLQMASIMIMQKPFVIHYMDDWITKVHHSSDMIFAEALEEMMAWFFVYADRVLSISDEMTSELVRKYGVSQTKITKIHNFISSQINVNIKMDENIILRYFGGLEEDMSLSTVLEISRQVQLLNPSKINNKKVTFEIFTTPQDQKKFGHLFEGSTNVVLKKQIENYEEYLHILATSSINFICYNFDDRSLLYTKYSLANKLPELVASGSIFVAIGHPDIATMKLLMRTRYPFVITQEDWSLEILINEIFISKSFVKERGDAYHESMKLLTDEFSEVKNKTYFHNLLRETSKLNQTIIFDCVQLKKIFIKLFNIYKLNNKNKYQIIDLDILFYLLHMPKETLEAVRARVRSHGIEWSVSDDYKSLNKSLKPGSSLQFADSNFMIRSVSFLISSLNHERYVDLNTKILSHLRDKTNWA